MIKLMKSKKGASSILVILLLIVLVVFGVAALTTALSNVRLGQKVVDWNEKYYAAEARASEVYAQIDSAVKDADPMPIITSSFHPSTIVADIVENGVVDIETGFGENDMYFTYETWQQEVGIRVMLSLSMGGDELTITEWRVIQQ